MADTLPLKLPERSNATVRPAARLSTRLRPSAEKCRRLFELLLILLATKRFEDERSDVLADRRAMLPGDPHELPEDFQTGQPESDPGCPAIQIPRMGNRVHRRHLSELVEIVSDKLQKIYGNHQSAS